MTYLLLVRYRTPAGRWRHSSTNVYFGWEELQEGLRSHARPHYRTEIRTFSRYDVAKLLETA